MALSKSPRVGMILASARPLHNLFIRNITTQVPIVTAAEAADYLLRTFKQPIVRKQILDGNQQHKLSLTLGRTRLWPDMDVSGGIPPLGTPLPPGYHLVYFTPSELETDLGADGSDRTFNPPAPFTRRMWAGGRMQWPDKMPLRVGERVEEVTQLVGATVKKSRDGATWFSWMWRSSFGARGGCLLLMRGRGSSGGR